MEKTESKTRRYTSIVIIICLSSFLVGLCIYFYNASNSLETELNSLLEQELVLNNSLDEINKNVNNISSKIEEYKNLENNIKEIKDIYFENALKLDTKARNGELKVAYLTFDDGPYLLTERYLDCLKEYDVQATFFIRQRLDPDYDEIYKRYKLECHTIGNHTASHDIFKGLYASETSFVNDVLRNREFIQDKLGYTTTVMRFPGGSNQANYMGLSKTNIVKKLVENGYGYVDWNLATGDGGATHSEKTFLHNVIDNLDDDLNVAVVLMHDYSYVTINILPDIIETMSDKGYIFLPLFYESSAVKKQ